MIVLGTFLNPAELLICIAFQNILIWFVTIRLINYRLFVFTLAQEICLKVVSCCSFRMINKLTSCFNAVFLVFPTSTA